MTSYSDINIGPVGIAHNQADILSTEYMQTVLNANSKRINQYTMQ